MMTMVSGVSVQVSRFWVQGFKGSSLWLLFHVIRITSE